MKFPAPSFHPVLSKKRIVAENQSEVDLLIPTLNSSAPVRSRDVTGCRWFRSRVGHIVFPTQKEPADVVVAVEWWVVCAPVGGALLCHWGLWGPEKKKGQFLPFSGEFLDLFLFLFFKEQGKFLTGTLLTVLFNSVTWHYSHLSRPDGNFFLNFYERRRFIWLHQTGSK